LDLPVTTTPEVRPEPGLAGTLDDLVRELRRLKVWAGDPSYDVITARINQTWRSDGRPAADLARRTTVADCFRPGRRRVNHDLLVAVVRALEPEAGYVTRWRRALQVIGGAGDAAAQVQVSDALPPDLPGFTGRAAEAALIRRGLAAGVVTIAGMAGVGKTRLAVHTGHQLDREQPFDRILFADLRGFHPDAARPPADPGAVLGGFLRLLGLSGQQIPPDLPGRAAAYRDRLAGLRALVVLDNAADAAQVRPLLPAGPGAQVLVTSRRTLAELPGGTHLAVDVFTVAEAVAFLTRSVPAIPAGPDPRAAARIAERCGCLPLALGLITGHIRGVHGWTLTDHADRLDDRHAAHQVDGGVELAVGLSYQQLPSDRQRLLRLAALDPATAFDAYAVAALTGSDPVPAGAALSELRRDHLLQEAGAGRYTLHDLIRAYTIGRAHDEDPPPARRAALTRLFDYYLAASARAMDTLAPAEAHHRPRIDAPATPLPELADPAAALAWLDAERPALVAVAVHAAAEGWPAHAVRLSSTLLRYLDGGYAADALTLHGHAWQAAQLLDDPAGQAHVLSNLGAAHRGLGDYGPAAARFEQALELSRSAGDDAGQARALGNLALVEERLGRYPAVAAHSEEALALFRKAGDREGEARALINLGIVEGRLGRYGPATGHLEQARELYSGAGDRTGEATALLNLGEVDDRLGLLDRAGEHLGRALVMFRELGIPGGAAWALGSLGGVHTHRGEPGLAVERLTEALELFRTTGDRAGEAFALNGLGEAAVSEPAEAVARHEAADAIAAEIGVREEVARAQAGLGRALLGLADGARAGRHLARALAIYTELGMPEAARIRSIQEAGRPESPP
jgi:tetratricopeptide (TPR) repeat protein